MKLLFNFLLSFFVIFIQILFLIFQIQPSLSQSIFEDIITSNDTIFSDLIEDEKNDRAFSNTGIDKNRLVKN